MRAEALALVLALSASQGVAQDRPADRPMSAIDWLSDSVATPASVPAGPLTQAEPGVTTGASIEAVTVAPLGRTVPDAVGILPVSVTGLPRNLWGASRPDDLALRIREERADMLPAMQQQLYSLLLAELDPAEAVGATGYTVFLARVDKLLELGALDQAEALLERAGPENPEIFRRWFDTALLLGHEDRLCDILRATPELSPTFPARIFCLARGGDWNAAALTLETGRALGFISPEDDALLARFLDPELFEGEPALPRPNRPSPLTFRMFEAVGEPIPTTTLPLAFAQSDLRANIGWKARVEAAERLARTGAVTENQLLGLYNERQAAASGGIWDRIDALQALDQAIGANNSNAISEALPAAWRAMAEGETEVPFARVYGKKLAGRSLHPNSTALALRLGLLSDDYEEIAGAAQPVDAFERLLVGVARGDVTGLSAPNGPARAVLDGFSATEAPIRLRSLLESDRLGEAILRAMSMFNDGTRGDLDEVSDALALFRAVGLEDTARRAALEYLILDRRG